MNTNNLSITIREVLYENILINEGVWDSKNGDLRYWSALFNRLKSAGLNPKYSDKSGKQINDPKLATFMYSGTWVIWKDTNHGNGYFITNKRKGKTYSAKITSYKGKYAGEDITKTTVGVYDNKTKSLVTMSLKDFLSGSDEVFMTKFIKSGLDANFKKETEKIANNVVSKLKGAFDMDKDGVYDDYDGTLENDAVSAIYSIKNKNQLDAVNNKIKSLGIASSLKQWVNWEMSDFDPQEYRKLWKHLESLGYKGASYNNALAAAGIVYDASGGKVLEDAGQALQQLKNLTVKDIMEGFRGFLSGAAGGVVQLLLTVFGGPLGAGLNMFAWSSLLVWDIYEWTQNRPNWWNLIVDLFSVVTTGVAGKFMSPAKAVSAEAKTAKGMLTALSKKFPAVAKYVKGFAGKLASLGKGAVNGAKNAIGWLSNKLPFLKSFWNKLNVVVGKIGGFISTIDEALTQVFGGKIIQSVTSAISNQVKTAFPKIGNFLNTEVGKEFAKKLAKQEVKAIENWVSGPLRGKTMEFATNYVCKAGSANQCELFKKSNIVSRAGLEIGKAGKSGTDVNATLKDKTANAKKKLETSTGHVKDLKSAEKESEEVIKEV